MISTIFEFGVLAIYAICLSVIVIYSFGQLHLVFSFLRNKKNIKVIPPLSGNENLPFVTIQLPIFNEMYVVERLLDATVGLDYPKDRFEIQVLDDSNDETVEIIREKVAALSKKGFQITQVRRPTREGFKAGALGYGLDFAKGSFIAIFDADFLPQPNFLRATLANFIDEKTGVVQARWEHINKHYSVFTEVQAFHLDAHFTVEQSGRSYGGYFMNFNGTAGVWRKECIIDAGGWHADTLTEDLDLSYRAQLKGWKFRYIDGIGAPAELPAEMGAIKSQQYRWMKGGAEVARKCLGDILKSDQKIGVKIHGALHLLSSSVFIFVLILGTLSVPLLYIKHHMFQGKIGWLILPTVLLMVSFVILGVFYGVTVFNREKSTGASLKRLLFNFIPFLSLSMGLSFHNTRAVIQGYLGKQTPFIRTPKFNIQQKGDGWKTVKYKSKKIKPGVIFELLLAAYFFGGILLSFHYNDFAILPFLLMQCLGFAAVGFTSVRHAMAG